MAFLSQTALAALGFRSLGRDVLISEHASLYNCGQISIGDYCRIDDFCVLSAGDGGIEIGRFVHLAIGCSLIGKERIRVGDFAGISARSSVYSSNDDYSGAALTGPTVPEHFRDVTHASVLIGKHVIIGAGSVVLPGLSLGDGAAVGALSLVNRDCEPFTIYAGNPARKIRARRRDLLDKEAALEDYLRAQRAEH